VVITVGLNNFLISLINLYIPHGSRDKSKLNYELKVYKNLLSRLKKRRDEKLVLVGDFNIAHKQVDLARPKQNKSNIMFTPQERKQLDNLVDLSFIDSFRKYDKQNGNYTWWPWRYNARKRNLGWRIDYTFISKKLMQGLKNAFINREVEGSDHCPVSVLLGL
jgi:exodeoxyribonuclease-3